MSSALIKYLACLLMLIDHVGICLFPKLIIFRIIGRLSFPLFAFQVSVSYKKTSNKKRYFLRMFIFAIASQIPFMLFKNVVNLHDLGFNIGFTFLFSIICFNLIDISRDKKNILPVLGVLPILILSYFLNVEYSFYGILISILFYIFDIKKDFIWLFISIILSTFVYINVLSISYIQFYASLVLPILLTFNGKKGNSPKYLFYIFYPAQFLILYLIKLIH